MAGNYATSFLDGTTRVLELPADGEPTESRVLPVAIVPLSGGGVYEFRPLNVLYAVDTATNGASTLTVDSAITAKTPSSANLVVGGDTYAYTVNRSNATFNLASPLTQTYTAGTQVSISTAPGTIDIDMRDADFQVDGSDPDGLIVQTVGRDLNLVVGANVNYSQSPGNAEVLIRTSASTPWKPSDATTTGSMPYWEPAAVFWDDDLINEVITWESVDGNWRLRVDYSGDANKFELTTGAQNFAQTDGTGFSGFTLQEKISSNPDVWTDSNFHDGNGEVPLMMMLFGELVNTGNNNLLQQSGGGYAYRFRSGTRIQASGTSGTINFDGISSSSVLSYVSGNSFNFPAGTTNSSSLGILIKNTVSSRLSDLLFDGIESAIVGFVLMKGRTDSDLSEADEQLLYRYAHQQYLSNWGSSPISATLQDRDTPPTAGATNAINVSVPTLSITFQNAPTGTALNVWDNEDKNASADHGTLLFTATPDGTSKVWDSGVTAGNDVIVQWVPSSPFALKEINFPYTIPSVSSSFDFAPLLEAEDGI